MSIVTLNFARKWRSKQFDQLIGQELPVRMLKNSLYLDHYFPVYLFAGQRGCGKTSTARIFAAAINCEMLDQFQKNPKESVLPCLQCTSCRAMATNQHPDFCEIDAASHTGVDMIRQVIDASLLLPLLGRKKIYLIDEAHMLSKASFNALLKVLEEPPRTVVFMLATTDAQKIIETVRSRCFQLFFKPVEQTILVNHLTTISMQEQIPYETDGLALIAQESDGSVRDAINLLEQVRFASDIVNKDAVLRVLGHIDDEQLLTLIDAVFSRTPAELLAVMHDLGLTRYSPLFIWSRLSILLRDALWLKYGVVSDSCDGVRRERLQAIIGRCSLKAVHALLEHLYNNESVFLKTTAQHAMIEMVLLQICLKNRGHKDGSGSSSPISQQSSQPELSLAAEDRVLDNDTETEEESDEDNEEEEDEIEDDGLALWASFITEVMTLNDPVLQSIFTQARFHSFDTETKKLEILFSKDFVFFKDWLDQARPHWMPLLKKTVAESVDLAVSFTQEVSASFAPDVSKIKVRAENISGAEGAPIKKSTPMQQKVETKFSFRKTERVNSVRTFGTPLNISDAMLWPKAHMIMQAFPGTVYAIGEEAQ